MVRRGGWHRRHFRYQGVCDKGSAKNEQIGSLSVGLSLG
jgi:hypothetical protein